MTGGKQARDAIDRRTEIVAVALVGIAAVNGHAHAQSVDRIPIFRAEVVAGRRRGGDRALDVGKRGAERVADGLENATAVRLDRGPHDRVVTAQRLLHRGAIDVPATRAALDVGKEKRDVSAR